MPQGKRCAWPGCRAWAMRGRDYCWAHRTNLEQAQAVRDEAGAGAEASPLGGMEPAAGTSGSRYRDLLARRIAAVLADMDRAESLADEIGALRLVLARVLADEDDPAQLATSIPRIVDAVVRAVRTQRTISGAAAENLTQAVTEVLIELGLDGQR